MVRRSIALTALALSLGALSGCAALDTHRVPGGPAGCKAVCEKWGMELSGMVQVGRDSDACVCAVRKEATSSLGAGAASAVAMVEQLRDEEKDDLQGGSDAKVSSGLLPPIRMQLPSSAGPGAPPPAP
jgi:hypothetical protein